MPIDADRKLSGPNTQSVADRRVLLAKSRQEASILLNVGHFKVPKGMYLYFVVNSVNLKMCIGITSNFSSRVTEHRNAAQTGSNTPFHRSIRKHGANCFVFVPIEQFSDEAALENAERQAILDYGTQDRAIGYNVADGGPGLGVRGAKEVHARPAFRAKFLASYPARAIKAAETRRRNLAADPERAG